MRSRCLVLCFIWCFWSHQLLVIFLYMICRLTLETDCQSSRRSCYMCIIKSCNKQHSKGNHAMFTPVLNGYDVIIMIMSLYFHCWEYCCIAVLLSLFLTKFWCCMQLNMPLNFSLFRHKPWEEKIHTAFEEADCQTYTHMCPSVPLPAPQQFTSISNALSHPSR